MKRYNVTGWEWEIDEDEKGEYVKYEDALREIEKINQRSSEADQLRKALKNLVTALEIPTAYESGEVGKAINQAEKLL